MEGGRRAGASLRWWHRALWGLAVAGFVVGFVLAAVLLTLRMTALNANWYRDAIDDSHAYGRVYDHVLTDPEVARTTRSLLAGLPIDESLVEANARIVLPPETVREIINRTLDSMVGYLRGDRETFDPVFALTPFFDNIRELADQYLSDTVTNLHPLQANTVDEFATNIVRFANDLGAGREPTALPTIPFTPDQAARLTELLLQPVPESERAALRFPLMHSLAAGDLNHALGTVAPAYGRDNTKHVIIDLRQDADGTHVSVDETFTGADEATIVVNLRRIRFLTGTVLPLAMVGGALLAIGCLVAIRALARRGGRRASTVVALTVITTALVLVTAYAAVRMVMGNPFGAVFGNSKAPPELRRLLGDIIARLFNRFDETLVRTVLLPAVAAILVLAWVVAMPWLRARARTTSPQRLVAAAGAVTAVLALLLVGLVAPRGAGAVPRRCNGDAALCDRRYDDTVFAESHNAMSASDLGWFGANQDVPFDAQLENGVRVLHIDTRYWETPEVTAKFASSLPTEQASVVLQAVAGANPVKPGVWLCHALCRLGATKLETALREIRDWVRSHPDDVLTLDIEDRASAEDTVAVFRRVGLARYAYTPGDPSEPWPTLGEMLDSGRRLVVFAERHGGQPRWFAQLYQYAMETPFTFAKQSAFTCKANRGGTGKRLFVMNHFVTGAAPSRSDAAVVNRRRAIVRRARHCAAVRGRQPNFVQVNFSTLGNVQGAVDVLNGLRRAR